MLDMEFVKHIEDTEILIVYNMTPEVEKILMSDEDNPFPFDDNGGSPDGPSWYIPLNEVSREVVDQIEINRLGRSESAHVFVDYDGSEEQKRELNEKFFGRWCGYSGKGIVYARDAE